MFSFFWVFQTGEVYFINWRTGMKSQEDPRINPDINCEFYNSEEDDSCYDSEGSSSESSSREQEQYKTTAESNINERAQVLVAAGCKSCLMYFMVPKQAEDCPKCYGQLLHFDRSENTSPWSNHYYYFWIIFPLFFFFFFCLINFGWRILLWICSKWFSLLGMERLIEFVVDFLLVEF